MNKEDELNPNDTASERKLKIYLKEIQNKSKLEVLTSLLNYKDGNYLSLSKSRIQEKYDEIKKVTFTMRFPKQNR
tara:strand:+ start:110 stop:334 length:225 start_codon:yes stop_codon:yes gene_type:complete